MSGAIAVSKGGFYQEYDSGRIKGNGNDDFKHGTNV